MSSRFLRIPLAARIVPALLVALALAPAEGIVVWSAQAGTTGAKPPAQGSDTLLNQIWEGIQNAQAKNTTGCGELTETRTSRLLKVPMVFRGRFCASGMDRFFLEYRDPEPVRLVFNRDYLNVTTGRERKTTEVLEIGGHVRKTQSYFSGENSNRNLTENFVISVKEFPEFYELKFVPRAKRFKQKLNYLVVTLQRNSYLLRTLEVDGAGGVNSVFRIEIKSLNVKVDEELFKVYKR